MRHAIAAAALLFSMGAAHAQGPTQKTGYQIPGCTWYMLKDSRVIRICNNRSTQPGPSGQPIIWETITIDGSGSHSN